jgi:hypothetical protein
VDFMDNFLAPTETCHTADNFGVALTAAQLAGGSGRDLMVGVAIGYTVQSRLVDHGNFMTRGFDHTAQLAFSHNAAAGRLLGLTEPQIANAIAMATASDASFGVIRAKPLSQWKGLASAQSALGAMNALFLARRGVEGPLRVIEGPQGIDNLLHMQLRVDWDHEGYEGVTTSTIKKYNAMIHTQSAIECILQLVAANTPRLDVAAGFDPGTIVSIEAEVPQITYDFAGGGLYGSLTDVRTKEQADHDLRYLLAVALLDGNVLPAQFAAGRITRPDVQSLLAKVPARAERGLHRRLPAAHAGEDHHPAHRRHHVLPRGTGLSRDAIGPVHLGRGDRQVRPARRRPHRQRPGHRDQGSRPLGRAHPGHRPDDPPRPRPGRLTRGRRQPARTDRLANQRRHRLPVADTPQRSLPRGAQRPGSLPLVQDEPTRGNGDAHGRSDAHVLVDRDLPACHGSPHRTGSSRRLWIAIPGLNSSSLAGTASRSPGSRPINFCVTTRTLPPIWRQARMGDKGIPATPEM